jgi:tRNA(Ile)-lysidine synthase
MKVELEPGRYIVAVSGGVDSVVLLNVLSVLPNLDLVIAHFDHGIRENSQEDAEFVQQLAHKHNLPFELGQEKLGGHTSEALARHHRYKFLHEVRNKYQAKAILTAHHEDDVIETAMINIIRGTKYRGIYALRSRETVLRPFRYVSKRQILSYAKTHKFEWREDSTNQQNKYLRNRLRNLSQTRLNETDRAKIIRAIKHVEDLGREIELISEELLNDICEQESIIRKKFILLPHQVSCEILATFLRNNHVAFDRDTIERGVIDIKTKLPGKVSMLPGGVGLFIGSKQISLQVSEVL